jgi:hypothetical protein
MSASVPTRRHMFSSDTHPRPHYGCRPPLSLGWLPRRRTCLPPGHSLCCAHDQHMRSSHLRISCGRGGTAPPDAQRCHAPLHKLRSSSNWAGKRAFRVGRGVCAPAQPIWAGKRSLLKWDKCLQQPQLTRHNHVAQRLCTWGTWYKPSVLASPAEWRRYPSDTSGGRPLTEAMISYPERASAVDGDVHRII